MKTIYTIYLSEDGLWHEAFSNKKALYDFINNIHMGYKECRSIGLYKQDLPFNYNNLLKALKSYSQFELNDGNKRQEFIRIQSITLLSKY